MERAGWKRAFPGTCPAGSIHPEGVPAHLEASRGWMLSWLHSRDSRCILEGQTDRGKRFRKRGMQGRQAQKPCVGGEGYCLLGNSGPFYFVAWVPRTEGIELFFTELCSFVGSR